MVAHSALTPFPDLVNWEVIVGAGHLPLRFRSAALLLRLTSELGELVKRIKASLIPISDNRLLRSSREDEIREGG